jgi:tetratricopeptide (TPR) repeat protein
MKTFRVVGAFLFGAILSTALYYGLRSPTPSAGERSPAPPSELSAGAATTPADSRVRAAEGRIKQRPQNPDGHNLLASAYMQKARETGDSGFNKKAEAALAESFRVAPDNYDALKLRAKLLLIYHRFGEALAEARRARELRPEDHDVYGALTDACVELGDYGCAVESAQRMVDLRPDAASYARVSYLRSLHGDVDGAVEAMEVAVKAADPRDPEASAWARTHLGDELLRLGRAAEAEREYDRALQLFPGHQLALAAKARARAAAGDFETAVELYNRLDSHDRHLGLGDIYTRLGRTEDARREYEAFERAEREAAPEENDYSHLARFWADRGTNLDEAVALMLRERERRADIYTCDALAWAYYRKGMLAEAKGAIEEALRTGSLDPQIHFHAGMIYHALGERVSAAKHLRLSLGAPAAAGLLQADAAREALKANGA